MEKINLPTTKREIFRKLRCSFVGLILVILGLFVLLNSFFPIRTSIDYAQIILSEEKKPLYFFLSKDDKWRLKSSINEFPEELIEAIIEKEDKFFYYHFGVNFISIAKAFTNNIASGKKVSGASTITMQVARLLDPKPRTYLNKLVEVFRAFQLEWKFSKDEILTMYLNLVPYGGNIEGVRAASLLYFGVEPNQLSLAQCIALSIVPNRPTSLAIGKNNKAIEAARNKWLEQYRKSKTFNNDAIDEAIAEPLDSYRRNSPKNAPHFSYRIHRFHQKDPVINTTLSFELQESVVELSKQYLRRTAQFGVYNSAVLVVDNATKNVVAYVGNPNFNDNKNAGQVDGTRALRSPGSTLKPFIYALTFDYGIYTPRSILYDVPTNFENYSPRNFDQRFNGKVTLKEALGNSLNVVAVKALEKIGVNSMISTLEKADFASISRSKHNLGLSLALGGCGVSLYEMAGIYSSLATNGNYKPLNYLQQKDTSKQNGIQLFSPESSYLITEILSEIDRPDLPSEYQWGRKVPKIAWKTGTSYGRKDAWSIGYNKKYTVAVWVGNFNNKGARALTGAGIATPLLFKIFNSIDYNSKTAWFETPESLKERVVCKESGLPPSIHCNSFITDFFIPKVSSIQQCSHQKIVYTSAEEDKSYCIHCLPSSGYKKKLFPNHTAEILTYYKQIGFPVIQAPLHNEACKHISANTKEKSPEIISPLSGREYIVDTNGELMLQCHVSNDVAEVYWYVNNQFIAKTEGAEKVFITPPRGKVKISCSDDRGRNTDTYITVTNSQ